MSNHPQLVATYIHHKAMHQGMQLWRRHYDNMRWMTVFAAWTAGKEDSPKSPARRNIPNVAHTRPTVQWMTAAGSEFGGEGGDNSVTSLLFISDCNQTSARSSSTVLYA